MKHLIKKENNIIHGTLGWSHNGKDGQYCEAGETVKIKWQPTAGWGLQEVHYTDGDGNVVAIEGGEFVMPDSAVTVGATFKKFVIGDLTEGKDAAENAGKVLGFDEGGNLVPVEGGGGLPFGFAVIDVDVKNNDFDGGVVTINGVEYPMAYGDQSLYIPAEALPVVQQLARENVIVTYSHQDNESVFPPRYYVNALVYDTGVHLSPAATCLYIFQEDQQIAVVAFGPN